MEFAGKTYWLIGASEGIGAALATQLSNAGARLILTARNQAALEDLAKRLNGPAEICAFDLCDQEAMSKAIAGRGRIDGLIYSAGAYEPMRAEDWDPQAVQRMIEVNFVAAARVIGAVMPGFIAQNQGHIVLVGSLAGFTGLPGSIGYAASKAGLMQLGEAMQMDLAGRPIRVQIVNPGFVKTRLTAKNDFAMPFLMTADQAATRIARAMHSGRYVTHFPWIFSLLFRVARLLPTGLRIALFNRRQGFRADG